jgi:SAM-dependent methyltransferase
MRSQMTTWPKKLLELSPEQRASKDAWSRYWVTELAGQLSVFDWINRWFFRSVPSRANWKVLEVGPGIGASMWREGSEPGKYHCLEYNPEYCKIVQEKFPDVVVHQGDIQDRQDWAEKQFDRVIAVHVLEHLPNLPAALTEIERSLRDGGVFDVVIPCEDGLLYTFARTITTKRIFERKFNMPFRPIIKSDHVNNAREVLFELKSRFNVQKVAYYPLLVPSTDLNLCIGLRLTRKPN